MPQTYWARIDSNNANNPALNLTGDPAFEITFARSGANGDLLIEYNGGSPDPDTQIEIGGMAYDFTFELSAALPTLAKDGAGQVPDKFEGSSVYIVTVQDYPAVGQTTRVTFMPQETATQTEMDAFGVGATSLQNVDTTTTGAVCFGEGTLIETQRGSVPVERLEAGDLVQTLDHGPQPIVWTSYSEHRWPGSPENFLPILISRNSFGPGLPKRDLVVSPQHKILVSPTTSNRPDNSGGLLAPAKGLTWMSGIRRMDGKRSVSYHHILMRNHEVLLSEGLPSESFFPGPTAMRMLAPKQRAEILSHFPRMRSDIGLGYGATVRPALTVGETQKLAKNRHFAGRRCGVRARKLDASPSSLLLPA